MATWPQICTFEQMKRIIVFIVTVLTLTMTIVYAHPGGTDSNGGHTNHSTGEYHYHHGYEAHQHTNGVCPFDFDDKTGQSSGPSSGANNETNKEPQVEEEHELSLFSRALNWIGDAVLFLIISISVIYLLSMIIALIVAFFS